MSKDKIALQRACVEFENDDLVQELVDTVVIETFKQEDKVTKDDK